MRALMCLLIFLTSVEGWTFESPQKVFDSKKTKVVVFLSSVCPCSKSHREHLNELSKTYKDVDFFGVITDQIVDSNRKFVNEYYSEANYNFPIVKDEKQLLVKQYGALKTPHVTMVKDSQQIYQGGLSDHRFYNDAETLYLKNNLEALSKKQPMPHSEGLSMGCYIRRI